MNNVQIYHILYDILCTNQISSTHNITYKHKIESPRNFDNEAYPRISRNIDTVNSNNNKDKKLNNENINKLYKR